MSHRSIRYLEALLALESEERDNMPSPIGCTKTTHRMKALEEFEFAWAPQTPMVVIGGSGTGNTYLATGLRVETMPLEAIGTEFLFPMIAERTKRATVIATTSLPFSTRWCFQLRKACKAVVGPHPKTAHISSV
jgi:hypothetical protein